MTIPSRYANNFAPIKYMLSSYRALSDGRAGIQHLEELLRESQFLFSEWKIVWTGACATLRTSIDLFKIDAKSCLSVDIRREIRSEWDSIKKEAEDHQIYWRFLKEERDNIIHEYKWSAYEAWMKPDGVIRASESILGSLLISDGASRVLLMRNGIYAGRNSLDLLIEASDWVEARIFAAIRRAGFEPEEQRSIYDFRAPPKETNEGAASLLLGVSPDREGE